MKWCLWKTSNQDLGTPGNLKLQYWQHYASQQRIPFKEGPDILRWGHLTTGNFSAKEAYYLQVNHQNQSKENLWKPALWPKVSTFLWLVTRNRVLTWDNLRKRGFIGPSICILCHQQEETKEHLFNNCPFSQRIWDQGAQTMRKANQNRSNINEKIENWDSITYNNPLLTHIWKLLLGFILWQI
jgi:hypothetical protein